MTAPQLPWASQLFFITFYHKFPLKCGKAFTRNKKFARVTRQPGQLNQGEHARALLARAKVKASKGVNVYHI